MNKTILTWNDILNLLYTIPCNGKIVYGVPKGGMIAASFLPSNVEKTFDPTEADIILDDLIDSGKTKEKYCNKYPNKQFYALIDKQKEKRNDWIVFPWESDHPQKEDNIQDNITRQLQYIGEDCEREGLQGTPNRIVKMWDEIFAGYNMDPANILTTFAADGYDEIVLLKDVELYSMCEHHILPFFGKAHVAYIPNEKVIGISKLARLVDIYAKRLQIQERIGDQVTSDLMKYLEPKGAACVIEATHMCMRMRGVEKQNSVMTTSSMKGVFREVTSARSELMNLIK